MQALENGNTLEETDAAALMLGIPMPPSALLAMVGPRVANHVLHTLHGAYPDRSRSPTLENFANGGWSRRHGRCPTTVDELHPPSRRSPTGRRMLAGRRHLRREIDACLIRRGLPFFRGAG
jgi:3-hydroxyacyl-CoA dehydrogenase